MRLIVIGPLKLYVYQVIRTLLSITYIMSQRVPRAFVAVLFCHNFNFPWVSLPLCCYLMWFKISWILLKLQYEWIKDIVSTWFRLEGNCMEAFWCAHSSLLRYVFTFEFDCGISEFTLVLVLMILIAWWEYEIMKIVIIWLYNSSLGPLMSYYFRSVE